MVSLDIICNHPPFRLGDAGAVLVLIIRSINTHHHAHSLQLCARLWQQPLRVCSKGKPYTLHHWPPFVQLCAVVPWILQRCQPCCLCHAQPSELTLINACVQKPCRHSFVASKDGGVGYCFAKVCFWHAMSCKLYADGRDSHPNCHLIHPIFVFRPPLSDSDISSQQQDGLRAPASQCTQQCTSAS